MYSARGSLASDCQEARAVFHQPSGGLSLGREELEELRLLRRVNALKYDLTRTYLVPLERQTREVLQDGAPRSQWVRDRVPELTRGRVYGRARGTVERGRSGGGEAHLPSSLLGAARH